MEPRQVMLGNEAMARGLLENGCVAATAYPGTPSSEILTAVAELRERFGLSTHAQWAVNEKVAFEIAYAAAIAGLRAAVAMKQVGLNVAADPLMSAAYMGVRGGFVVVSADDPGPHSSQTEQDSRLMALLARVPVLDPASPREAREMIGPAFELSERFEVPVMLRPTTRICHSRQDMDAPAIAPAPRRPEFRRDPSRWAATPKFRLKLHRALEAKLDEIARYPDTAPVLSNPGASGRRAVVASGVVAAHAEEILADLGLAETLPLFRVRQPFPLHVDFIERIRRDFDEILVVEETMPVIEMQIADRDRVRGRMDGTIPAAGELLPETVAARIARFAGIPYAEAELPAAPGRRPTLCPGCPHRASFFAIKKAAPRAIYASDIGCYTLGLNLGAVDTVLCMGAAIGQGAGFFHAFRDEEKPPDVVATLGDSTFFHAGIPPLIDAVVHRVGMVLVILDNRTTAMTGNQPTPDTGIGACGEATDRVDIPTLVRGCGVNFCEIGDPCDLKAFTRQVREAVRYSREKRGPAVVIARRPCLLDRRQAIPAAPNKARASEHCDGCGFCVQEFECPALALYEAAGTVRVDRVLCSGCGVCVQVCAKGGLEMSGDGDGN